VPNPPLQDDRLARLGVARLLDGKLKPKLARHNGDGLFLKVVQMHRRTDIRRSKEFDLHVIAVSITNDAEKGDHLALAVLDLVRICVQQAPPILQTSLVRSNDQAEPQPPAARLRLQPRRCGCHS
jgi:hypothetical protein